MPSWGKMLYTMGHTKERKDAKFNTRDVAFNGKMLHIIGL